MSVINKMLRDLDQRQVPDDNGAVQPGATPLRSGTASVAGVLIPTKPSRRGPSTSFMPLAVAVAALAVCGGAAYWWLHKAPQQALPTAVAQAAPASAAQVVPASALAAAIPTTSAATSAAASATNSATATPVAAGSSAAKPAITASAPAVVQTMAKAPQATTSVPASASVAVPAPLSVQQPAASDVVPISQRQQQAAREALAQAQTLWNSGAHDNAIDLLQQAVATAERSAQSAPGAPATQALASLARELARMQVAQGRPGATVDMLARLEPLLFAEPDIWAVRANAAQRAGRHQDSVSAYTTALQARPNEQRWLLGAAVSSAALGQTANAAALADKAAAVGPVPKDVQAYLRQLGVPLKD